jgi:hypothetical protein
MVEMKCTYNHVSDCKTELVRKGWIARKGRRAVELLVGTFPAPKVRELATPTGSNFGKFRTSTSENSEVGGSNFGKFRTSTSENSEVGERAPIYEPVVEPVAAAATAAERENFLREQVDEEFVREVIAAGVYPEQLVNHVWKKLKLHCVTQRTVPVKKQFLHWLSTERPSAQPALPEMGAAIVEGRFAARPPVSKAACPPDPNCSTCRGQGKIGGVECGCTQCPVCFGSGMEITEKGARRCRCRDTARSASSEEAVVQHEAAN